MLVKKNVLSVFEGSPYIDAPISKLEDKIPFDVLTLPYYFNYCLNYQYEYMDRNHLWMDSLPYIHRFLRTYFGNDIKANF